MQTGTGTGTDRAPVKISALIPLGPIAWAPEERCGLDVFGAGCRPAAAEVLVDMPNQGVIPTVPSQGSVGAAGDLAPLAHIARVACGYAERPDTVRDYRPNPKEALALINGVSMTAALGAVAVVRVRRVLDAAIAAAAMTMEAVGAGAGCIDERLLRSRNRA